MDIVADATIVVTFLSGILFETPMYAKYSDSLGILVFLLNVSVTVMYAIIYFKKMIKRNLDTIKQSPSKMRKLFKRALSLLLECVPKRNPIYGTGTNANAAQTKRNETHLSSTSQLPLTAFSSSSTPEIELESPDKATVSGETLNEIWSVKSNKRTFCVVYFEYHFCIVLV